MTRRAVYLWDADYPWDVRTEKMCRALTDGGYEVHIVARNRAWREEVERLPEGTVHRMTRWRWLGRRFDNALSFPAFFSPRWSSLLARTVAATRPSVIIARDLPLCPTAIHVGRRYGVPIILDMAENYPAMMRDVWTAGRHRPLDAVVRNPRFVAMVERYCVARVAHVLTVVEESSARVARLGVPPERITVVSNTPPRARVASGTRAPTNDEGITVVYLGLLEVPRGVGEAIEAMALLREHVPRFTLRIIGDGRDEALFRTRAEALGVLGREVEFLGRLPYPEALEVVAGADVGIIPHHATESWNTTVPNKLFDYMAAGLPVVSSDAAPCVRILGETGAGVVFRSGDARHLADVLRTFVAPEYRNTLGDAGRSAILGRYNWEYDSAALLRVAELYECSAHMDNGK